MEGGVNGQPVQLLIEDSTKASEAISAYYKLHTIEGVRHIVGLFNAEEVEAVTPLSAKDNVFVATFVFTEKKPRKSLLVWIDPYYETELVAEQMIRGYKKVAVLGSEMGWDQIASWGVRAGLPKTGRYGCDS